MHRRAAHGTAGGAWSVASMHAMQTCVRGSMRGIAHARWVQGNVGSADDPHRLALSASKTRHTGAQAHARRDNDGPRILERGVDDPLNLDENPRRRCAGAVLAVHGSGAGCSKCAGDSTGVFTTYSMYYRSDLQKPEENQNSRFYAEGDWSHGCRAWGFNALLI
jgi:hypothetical protein